MKNIIYYFTGTGNSLIIAKTLQNQLEDTVIRRISQKTMIQEIDPGVERIGFVYPVYYRGLPDLVVRFIEQLKIPKKAYVFALANYGGSSASSLEQVDNLLKKKNRRLHADFGMEMPGNMWSMYYPHPKEVTVERLATQVERAVCIAKVIQEKSVSHVEKTMNSQEDKEEYYKIKEIHTKDYGFWYDENCTGCGICRRVCPVSNIKYVDKKPIWQHRCEYCLACMHWCPARAIQFEKVTLGKERYQNPEVKRSELFED